MAKKCASDTSVEEVIFVSYSFEKKGNLLYPSTHFTELTLAAFKYAKERHQTGTPFPYNDFEELKNGDPDEAARCLRFVGFASIRSDLISWIELDGEIADPENMTGRRQNGRWWGQFVWRWRSRS
jgi:hypothetical protein